MVVRMASNESNASPANSENLSSNFDLPVFEEPLIDPWPKKMAWEDAVRSFAAAGHYMRAFRFAGETSAGTKTPPRFG